MIRGLYTAVSGMITQEAKQDVVTNNLANANTTGYKGDNLAIKEFDEVLIQNYDKVVGGKNVRNIIGSLSMGSEIDETNVDFSQGMLKETGTSTDFALEGRGFFSVLRTNELGDQNTYYTRDGHFHVNGVGELVTDIGDKVLGINSNNGEIQPIIVGNSEIKVDIDKNVWIDNNLNYKMNIVDFQDYNGLQKMGDNLLKGENPIEANDSIVKQNNLENSNVNVINEMVNMITVMRSFETNQRVIQTIDNTLGKAANEVGSIR